MSILSRLFGAKKPPTASVAKERLQIVLAHERGRRDAPDFLPVLQQELLAVVAKYFHVQDEMIKIQVERSGETSVLEINVELDKARIRTRGEAAKEQEQEEEQEAKETSSASEA